jgi:pimeloyl-ACP methyl ester carboxylesterase
MAARAVALMPAASQWKFEGIGHCVAQEAPERMLKALKTFANDTRN